MAAHDGQTVRPMIQRALEAARCARPIAALALATVIVAGCSETPPPAATPISAAPTGTNPDPAVRSVIDAHWTGFEDRDGSWRVLVRTIGEDRQRLDLQPSDESFVFPNACPGCNHSEATVALTVYERGAYDPAAVRTGEPVTVNGAQGHFVAPRWPAGPVLGWEYAPDSWATAQGRSQTTGDLARLQDVASRLRPAERLPIGFPLSLSTLPQDMPLSGVSGGSPGPRLTLSFDGLSVRLWATDEFPAHRVEGSRRFEVFSVPVQIGGRDGFLLEDNPTKEAGINVAPGVTVTFELSSATLKLQDVLDDVEWAPDPTAETSWRAVADWT